MKYLFNFLGVILIIIAFHSCKQDKPKLPDIITSDVTAVTYTTATSGGDVTNEGGAAMIARGVCWNTSPDPTITNNINKTVINSGLGTFVSFLTLLTPNTTYYIRAYATNSVGTAYGSQVSFTTPPVEVPVVTTAAIAFVSQKTASSGGNITDEKGGSVIARGVCWDTSSNPTIALTTKTTNNTGPGVFTSSITGLTAGTTYYVRAYATNSEGTGYGNDISFITNPADENTGTVFKVYGALLYSGKPDLNQYGIYPIKVVYTSELWKSWQDREYPIEANVRESAKTIVSYNNPVVIDIEHWKLTGDEDTVKANIKKMADVIEWFRSERPEEKFGFYGVLPQREYWPVLLRDARYEDWLKGNERLNELADHVDAVFPSLYTFYNNPEGWEIYAIENLKEARKYGKPVYAFLWPMYHDSNTALKGTHIDSLFWRKQLDICKQYADGVVIWGGYQVTWNPQFEWWKETIKFMESLNVK